MAVGVTSTARLERHLDAALQLVAADRIAVMVTVEGISRCISGRGLTRNIFTRRWTWDAAPIKPNATIVALNEDTIRYAGVLAQVFRESSVGLFVRKPICVTKAYVAEIQIVSLNNSVAPAKSDLKILDSLCKAIGEEIQPTIDTLVSQGSALALSEPLAVLLAEVRNSSDHRAVLDSQLRFLAVTNSLAGRLGHTPDQIIGKTPRQIGMPGAEPITFLLENSLVDGQSTPSFEIASDRTGMRRRYRVSATPLQPIDQQSSVLDLLVTDVAENRGHARPVNAAENQGFSESADDPTAAFLMQTLIRKRAIRSRKDVNYVTLRSWRTAIREHQIIALRAQKRNISRDLVEAIGKEIALEIQMLVGKSAFKSIVPMPCGHSSFGSCLSLEIARAVGAELGLTLLQPFVYRKLKGSSHPKSNVTRPPLKLVEAVKGNVLLVDDVATSGAHICEAVMLMQAQGASVFAVAWIGGDAA